MDNIDKILKYIRRTNPDMTRQKLIEELGQSHYLAKALVIVSHAGWSIFRNVGSVIAFPIVADC